MSSGYLSHRSVGQSGPILPIAVWTSGKTAPSGSLYRGGVSSADNPIRAVERLSIEVTNRCGKACAFCYNRSAPSGESRWRGDDLVGFVRSCAENGTRAVSFGGGEPLEHPELCDALAALDGVLFRSVTTNGLPLEHEAVFSALVNARPEKVHVSVHCPEHPDEVCRVIAQVRRLEAAGLRSGVNLLVAPDSEAAATSAYQVLLAAGIGPERVILIPLRGGAAPSPELLGRVAGGRPFQSTSCLLRCGPSPRFCSIGWDRSVAWCSYTPARGTLESLTFAALAAALARLRHQPCGA